MSRGREGRLELPLEEGETRQSPAPDGRPGPLRAEAMSPVNACYRALGLGWGPRRPRNHAVASPCRLVIMLGSVSVSRFGNA